MAKRTTVDTDGNPVPRFSWKRLSKSIVREMYNRAVSAAEKTQLSTEQRMGLMDRIGRWAASKIVEKVTGKRVSRGSRAAS